MKFGTKLSTNAFVGSRQVTAGYYGDLLIPGMGGVTPLLDIPGLQNAFLAYSPFRRLTSRYTGNAIIVRRSSDNAEQAIGFVDNVLDHAALLSFCGAGNGFVKTVYNQAADENHLVQETTTAQFQIVASGQLVLRDFRAVLLSDGGDDLRTAGNATLSDTDKVTALSCGRVIGNDKNGFISGTNPITQKNFYCPNSTSTGRIRVGTSSGLGGNNYNLWDRSETIANRICAGAIIDRALTAANEVMPILGEAISQTGWTQILTANMTGNFDSQVIRLGDSTAVSYWDFAILYKSVLSNALVSQLIDWAGGGNEGVSIGDSTVAAYLGTTAVGQFVYTDRERCFRSGISELAVPGHTIAQQKTVWTAYNQKNIPDWIMVQIGLNDMNPATATATTIAAYQDLITTIRSGVKSSCKIIGATMIPAYERWPAVGFNQANAQAKWVAVNDAIMGRGGSPITGLDNRIEGHTLAMSKDVSGNAALADEFNTGDGVHPNDAGRTVNASFWRIGLRQLGLI